MKKILSFLLFCFFIISCFAQIVVCPNDSLKITLSDYIDGSFIQWEASPDNTTYFLIPGDTNSSTSVLVNGPKYYRAKVQEDSACPIYYSDTIYTYNLSWNANLSTSKMDSQTVGAFSFYSASKLMVSWDIAPIAVDHYKITATENIKGTTVTLTSPSDQNSDTLTGLKSSTVYTVTIKGCIDKDCSSYISCLSNSVLDTTSEEYWQLQGTGDTTTTLTKIVSDGNTLNYAFVYGSWGPSSLDGYIRYYYNPTNAAEKGLKPSISNSLPQTNVNATVTSFTGLTGYGLSYNGWVTGNMTPKSIGQSAAIPYNGKIRVFFEAELDDNTARIFYIDSQDGYEGLDFNSGVSTFCTNPSDFLSTGGCSYTMCIGTETDTGTNYNASITDIRQFKIGYPTMDSWIWSGANNTFMTPTFDLSDSTCGNTYTFTTGYALWDSVNSKWVLQYEGSCPKFFDGMQAPSIMHLGDSKYKLYYNQNEILKGKPHNPQTDTKPMKVFYAEATNGIVNFEDWENVSDARDLNYLWPDGSLLSVSQESKIDDYHFFAPTNDLSFQVQYTNISNGVTPPFVAAAILLNP